MTQKENNVRNNYYLPDLNEGNAVLAMVLSIELIVFMLSLFKYKFASPDFFAYFFGLSFVMLWIAFVFAMVMGYLKPWLQKKSLFYVSAVQLGILFVITILCSAIARWVVLNFLAYSDIAKNFIEHPLAYFLQNGLISLIVGGLLMRYFYLAYQNEEKIKAVNTAQIQALQSRIRPHFLFNSLNSIASLIRIDKEKAEQAVEDLADLFRVSLANSERRVSIKEELEIARLYQRMEQLRLGERLQVKWDVSELPLRQKVPALMLQPLLENAIYHGIERMPEGGEIEVTGHVDNARVVIKVVNPVLQDSQRQQVKRYTEGNNIALENIQARLKLLYGEKAQVVVTPSDSHFSVKLEFPLEQSWN